MDAKYPWFKDSFVGMRYHCWEGNVAHLFFSEEGVVEAITTGRLDSEAEVVDEEGEIFRACDLSPIPEWMEDVFHELGI